MSKSKFVVLGAAAALLFIGILAVPAGADEPGDKFTRGAINTTTGWVELPYQVVTQSKEDPYRGMTYGFMDGLSNGLKRTLYGVWDGLTFLIPPHDQPKMQPETLFSEK